VKEERFTTEDTESTEKKRGVPHSADSVWNDGKKKGTQDRGVKPPLHSADSVRNDGKKKGIQDGGVAWNYSWVVG
jgi:hypothetical protein